MGDTSIIARRLKDGHVQYGCSGNGGYYSNVGFKLLNFYDEPNMVEYLFGLGQLLRIGYPHKDGNTEADLPLYLRHETFHDMPHYLGTTEREIFSKLMFVDYGYFYDIDNKWYYIKPGPFRIKIPLKYIDNITNGGDDYEFDEIKKIERDILNYVFTSYIKKDKDFNIFLKKKKVCAEKFISRIKADEEFDTYDFFHEYNEIFEYFDDWILVKTNKTNKKITDFILKKKTKKHIETINW